MHSLHILSHLEARESLNLFYRLMGQEQEQLEDWFDDLITMYFWAFWYHLGRHRFDKMKEFMLDEDHFTYSKTAVTDCVEQIALHHPDRRGECIAWFEEVMQEIISDPNRPRALESDFNALLICNIVDIKAIELKPVILQMFETLPVDYLICGDPEDCLDYIDSDKEPPIRSLFTIYEFYDRSNAPEFSEADYAAWEEPFKEVPFEREQPKVGRNDPCPCGSRKKYKKCCGDPRQ